MFASASWRHAALFHCTQHCPRHSHFMWLSCNFQYRNLDISLRTSLTEDSQYFNPPGDVRAAQPLGQKMPISCAVTCFGLDPLSYVPSYILHHFCLIPNSLCIYTVHRFPDREGPSCHPLESLILCDSLWSRPTSGTQRTSPAFLLSPSLVFISLGCWQTSLLLSNQSSAHCHMKLSHVQRKSPFFLLMGYNPWADWTDHPSPIPQVALHLDQFKQAQKRAEELMLKAQKSWVKHKDTPKYKVEDQVWLEGHHLCTN